MDPFRTFSRKIPIFQDFEGILQDSSAGPALHFRKVS
jgi:hypothetical protein